MSGITETRASDPAPARSADAQAAEGPPAVLFDGLVAALIGYVAIVISLAIWSVARGHSPFHAAALLGATLFFDTTPLPGAAIDPAHVLAYNGAHMLVFVVAGMLMAWLAELAEHIPQGWYLMGVGFLFVIVHVAAVPIWFDAAVQRELPLALIAIASMLAFSLMTLWLLREHPGLRAGAHEPDFD